MERLERLREPLVVIALVAVLVRTVLVLVTMWPAPGLPMGLTLTDLGVALVDPVLTSLLTALLVACWLAAPTPHARPLTAAGLVLTVALLVGAVVLGVVGLVVGRDDDMGTPVLLVLAVAPVTVAVVGVVVDLALLRRPSAGARPAVVPVTDAEDDGPEEPAEPAPDPQQQPAWTTDEAVGTVWRRAGDAGSQRPATSWDAPGGEDAGWGSGTGSAAPVQPTRRANE